MRQADFPCKEVTSYNYDIFHDNFHTLSTVLGVTAWFLSSHSLLNLFQADQCYLLRLFTFRSLPNQFHRATSGSYDIITDPSLH